MADCIVATALHRAAECGESLEVAALLDCGEEVDARLQEPDRRGRTPLMSAVVAQCGRSWHASDLRLIRSLLEAGADVNARDAEGATALIHAARLGADWRLVDLLIESGASRELCDWAGWDAYAHACGLKDDRVLERLRGNSPTCWMPSTL